MGLGRFDMGLGWGAEGGALVFFFVWEAEGGG